MHKQRGKFMTDDKFRSIGSMRISSQPERPLCDCHVFFVLQLDRKFGDLFNQASP